MSPVGRRVIVVSSVKTRGECRRDGNGGWARARGSPRTRIPVNRSARISASINLVISRLLSLAPWPGRWRSRLWMNGSGLGVYHSFVLISGSSQFELTTSRAKEPFDRKAIRRLQ
jgi:hypothetical protein